MQKNKMRDNSDERDGCPKYVVRYPINTTVDPEIIFCYPFLVDDETVSLIKKRGRVMFIIRGIPYTMKTKLSDLLREKYSNAAYCSAVKQLENCSRKPLQETKNSIETCFKMAKIACLNSENPIIVQNSHVQKFELAYFLKMAALYDYTVIMVATMYRFDVTVKALKNDDDLSTDYLQKRLSLWQDIPPTFTGWFIVPRDSEAIRYLTLQTLKNLFGEECIDKVKNHFLPRKILSCLAGYTRDEYAMTNYYLSDKVQTSYGKSFTTTIVGYIITSTDVIGIVQLNSDTSHLLLHHSDNNTSVRQDQDHENIVQYGKTTDWPEEESLPLNTTVDLEKWGEREEINVSMSSFIPLAQRGSDVFNIKKLTVEFTNSLQLIADCNGIIQNDVYEELDDGITKVCRLSHDKVMVKSPNKISFKTIFTGFYA